MNADGTVAVSFCWTSRKP